MERTQNDVLASTTQDYLATLDIANPPDAKTIEAELLDKIRFEFEVENAVKPKNRHWRIPIELPDFIIADIILKLHAVRRLLWSGTLQDGNYDLVMYHTDGVDVGIYTRDDTLIENLIQSYNHQISDRSVKRVITILNNKAATCRMNDNPDLIAVANGIFNYKEKILLPFSSDYVFTSKSSVRYNANVRNPVLHNFEDGTDWDVESWVSSLTDDIDIQLLIWQVIGSIIRPNTNFNKVVCFYSEQGNNGKGTLCALMRNLCGESSHASIPFSDFAREFMLEQLTHISAVITDENDVNDFTRVASSLKAAITGDYLTINRKFQKPITIQFKGIMIQCINALPRFGDRSDSLYRRFLLVPFDKCFTGQERKYIKDDYLNRQEVLEYVLFKVLHMDYDTFIEPTACLDLRDEYKIFNDPIRQFLDDVLDELVWDLVPYQFMYDLYKKWHGHNNPSGKLLGKQGFIKQLKQVLLNNTIWSAGDTPLRLVSQMNEAEPLIQKYDLREWMNTNYKGNDINLLCKPDNLSCSYRGMVRL